METKTNGELPGNENPENKSPGKEEDWSIEKLLTHPLATGIAGFFIGQWVSKNQYEKDIEELRAQVKELQAESRQKEKGTESLEGLPKKKEITVGNRIPKKHLRLD